MKYVDASLNGHKMTYLMINQFAENYAKKGLVRLREIFTPGSVTWGHFMGIIGQTEGSLSHWGKGAFIWAEGCYESTNTQHKQNTTRQRIGSPSMRVNFRLSSMGRLVGLQTKKPLSSNKAIVYFLWEREMSLLVHAISSPKKYLKGPRIFNLNNDWSLVCTRLTEAASETARIISST